MGRWMCQRCGINDSWGPLELKNGVCRECREEQERLEANIRNLQAWADKDGRRRVAAFLAHEAAAFESAPRAREQFTGRAFAWEMAGEARDLEWLGRRLSRWYGDKKRVRHPSEDAQQGVQS